MALSEMKSYTEILSRWLCLRWNYMQRVYCIGKLWSKILNSPTGLLPRLHWVRPSRLSLPAWWCQAHLHSIRTGWGQAWRPLTCGGWTHELTHWLRFPLCLTPPVEVGLVPLPIWPSSAEECGCRTECTFVFLWTRYRQRTFDGYCQWIFKESTITISVFHRWIVLLGWVFNYFLFTVYWNDMLLFSFIC